MNSTNYIRLFFIDSGECKTIKDITRGVFAVSEIEQFFFPYVSLNYLPFRPGVKGGIILVTNMNTISRTYDFSEESVAKDIEDMKKVIWEIIEKEGKIKNKDITDVIPGYTTFGVINSWKQKLKELEKNKCCKLITGSLNETLSNNTLENDFLRLSSKDEQTEKICKQVRGQDCLDNFRGANLAVCLSETENLCKIGYPENKVVNKQAEFVTKVRNNLMERLKKNNYLVDKRLFDDMVRAGMLSNIGEKIRNANTNIRLVKGVSADKFRIENFGNNSYNVSYLLLMIIIIIIVYYFYKNLI